MTKEELFKKYSINKTHNVWDDRVDNWMSVEIYRVMHEGNLPPEDDFSVDYITKFIDRFNHNMQFRREIMLRKQRDWGSLYLTAHRMVFRFADQLLGNDIFFKKAVAIELMAAGKKVRHEYFEENEFMFQPRPGFFEFEDGNIVTEEMFWHDRNHNGWDDGWQEVIEAKIEVTVN